MLGRSKNKCPGKMAALGTNHPERTPLSVMHKEHIFARGYGLVQI